MKKVAIGGMLIGLAFIIAGMFWLAYRNSVENDIAADQTPVQSPVVKTDKTEPTAKQGAQDAPTETAEGEAEAAANGDAPPLVTSPPVVYTKENGDMIGVTRQGNEYVINPLWYGTHNPVVHSASWRAAAAEPTGPPLTHDWAAEWAISAADWSDPRTWESYRNFWGFDRITTDENGQYPYRAVIDNWGDRIMWRKNTEVVRHYGRRVGFRPSPEQLERYLSLDAERKQALVDGDAAKSAARARPVRSVKQNDNRSSSSPARGLRARASGG